MNSYSNKAKDMEIDTNSILEHLIFKCKDLWSEIGAMQFETIVDHHVNRIYITALDMPTKNKANYLKEQVKIFEENYQGENILKPYKQFIENTTLPKDTPVNNINLHPSLTSHANKKEEIYAKLKAAFTSYKILSHNLHKKNYEEINTAEKSFFRKDALLKSAMNKTYETLFLYHMAYLKLETYNYLLSQFDNKEVVNSCY